MQVFKSRRDWFFVITVAFILETFFQIEMGLAMECNTIMRINKKFHGITQKTVNQRRQNLNYVSCAAETLAISSALAKEKLL